MIVSKLEFEATRLLVLACKAERGGRMMHGTLSAIIRSRRQPCNAAAPTRYQGQVGSRRIGAVDIHDRQTNRLSNAETKSSTWTILAESLQKSKRRQSMWSTRAKERVAWRSHTLILASVILVIPK